jgi:hypothetical protein
MTSVTDLLAQLSAKDVIIEMQAKTIKQLRNALLEQTELNRMNECKADRKMRDDSREGPQTIDDMRHQDGEEEFRNLLDAFDEFKIRRNT